MAPPGLEHILAQEVSAAGFNAPTVHPGGVTIQGGWPDVWRANLTLRGAGRVQARLGAFRAFHLAQLDKRARKFPWGDVLRPEVPVRVEVATNRKSKIYHAGAAQQRIETAITEELGAPIDPKAQVVIRARIDDNLVILSVDTSGAPLHKRGHKAAVGKAPLRETMAALLLRASGFTGTEAVVDPMCGSGTFVIEAAEIAAGVLPGRDRAFAFEQLATFDPDAWAALRSQTPPPLPDLAFHGSDRDAGAFARARDNAERAGVAPICTFTKAVVSEATPPEGEPGLVIVNPPYGARIGDRKSLFGLYAAFGARMTEAFQGWRVAMVTSDGGLAKASGLPFASESAPIAHGGLRVKLYQTAALGG
ncbi:class I SAM-dependent RNA methyltransferase [Jannaschia sp. AI_61]